MYLYCMVRSKLRAWDCRSKNPWPTLTNALHCIVHRRAIGGTPRARLAQVDDTDTPRNPETMGIDSVG